MDGKLRQCKYMKHMNLYIEKAKHEIGTLFNYKCNMGTASTVGSNLGMCESYPLLSQLVFYLVKRNHWTPFTWQAERELWNVQKKNDA